MRLTLHANATTTPKTRAYIQASAASEAELAAELGVSRKTVRRWRGRSTTQDRTSRPRTLAISLSPLEEELVRELRTRCQRRSNFRPARRSKSRPVVMLAL